MAASYAVTPVHKQQGVVRKEFFDVVRHAANCRASPLDDIRGDRTTLRPAQAAAVLARTGTSLPNGSFDSLITTKPSLTVAVA